MQERNVGIQKVANGVWAYLTSGVTMMSNAAIIAGDTKALMLDTFATVGLTETFLAEYAKISDKPVEYLVLSHAHGDHCHGAHLVKGAVILGHRGIKAAMDLFNQRPIEEQQRRYPHLDLSGARFTYPSIYLDGNASIDLGGRTVELLHYGRCHTDHDLMVYIPDARTIIGGDVLFNGICPVCSASDLDNYIHGLTCLLKMDIETFVSGHGPVGGREVAEELMVYLSVLKDAVDRVCQGVREEEAVDVKTIARFLREWKESYRFFESLEAQVAVRLGQPVNMRFDAERARRLQEKADRYAALA